MLRAKLVTLVLLAGVNLGRTPAAVAQDTRVTVTTQAAVAPAGQGLVVGHATSVASRGGATLTLELAQGDRFDLTLSRGRMLLNGNHVADFRSGGGLDAAWRELLQRVSGMSTPDALAALADFAPADLNGGELAGLQSFRLTAQNLTAPGGAAIAPLAVPDRESIRATARDAAQISAQVAQDVARAMEDVRRTRSGARQTVVPVGAPRTNGVGVGLVVSGLTNLAAVFIALTFMGVGMLFFAPKQLDAASDQLYRSFWGSFLAGLFAQPLIVPVFGMMIVGLTLTIVGILVVPFAVLAFIAALVLAVAGGFIAVARAVGEIYLKGKARGTPRGTWTPVKYIVYGLVGLLAVWLPGILLSWVPVAGTTLVVVAALLTWFVATAGFGATLISRGGIRGTVIRRIDAALTDEHYWEDVASLSMPGSRPSA